MAHAAGEAATSSWKRLQLEELFGIPHAMVRRAAAGDRSSEVKALARDGDHILNILVRKLLTDANRSQRSQFEANSILSWFLRDGTDMDLYIPHGMRHGDHSYGTMFEAMLQLAPDSFCEGVVRKYMAWVAERVRLELAGLTVEQDPETSAEVWRWETGVVVDEANLRMKLAQMHQAFESSWLGDVQEENELEAAIVATAAPSQGLSSAWMENESTKLAANDASLAAKQQREKQERLTTLQEQERRPTRSQKRKERGGSFVVDVDPKQELEKAMRLKWGAGGLVSYELDRPSGAVHLSPFICHVTVRPPSGSGAPQSFVGEPSIMKKQAMRNGFWAALQPFESASAT